jgi:hypothetical protein
MSGWRDAISRSSAPDALVLDAYVRMWHGGRAESNGNVVARFGEADGQLAVERMSPPPAHTGARVSIRTVSPPDALVVADAPVPEPVGENKQAKSD